MNWDALGAIAELIAAVAVVVTLVFLAIQIRTNNELARTANRDKTVDQFNEWRHLLGSNKAVADLWMRGCRGDDDLDEIEQFQFAEMARAFFLMYTGWERRARESGALEVVEIAATNLAGELQGDARAALRQRWSDTAADNEFSRLVSAKLEAMS